MAETENVTIHESSVISKGDGGGTKFLSKRPAILRHSNMKSLETNVTASYLSYL